MNQNSEEQSSQWAVVEIFGHKTIAGQITKETNLFPLLRIDVPATSDYPAYTVEYGPAAIYGITYVSEAVAKATAESLRVKPIAVYNPELITVYNPELITREQFEQTVDQYNQRIAELRGLPNPQRTEDRLRPFDREGYGEEQDDPDEDEPEMENDDDLEDEDEEV